MVTRGGLIELSKLIEVSREPFFTLTLYWIGTVSVWVSSLGFGGAGLEVVNTKAMPNYVFQMVGDWKLIKVVDCAFWWFILTRCVSSSVSFKFYFIFFEARISLLNYSSSCNTVARYASLVVSLCFKFPTLLLCRANERQLRINMPFTFQSGFNIITKRVWCLRASLKRSTKEEKKLYYDFI